VLQRTETSEAQTEAIRLMTICNACRYCEGLCAVFPAMERRRVFAGPDVDYLANLCHGCGACYYDCQYAPPHEFAVNVPLTLAALREETYGRYAWPEGSSGLFARNGLWIALSAALSVAAFLIGFTAWHGANVLFGTHEGPGAFYRLMPHNAMVILFGGAFLYALCALAMGLRRFWAESGGGTPSMGSLWRATADAGRLRYLDGGGVGCMNDDEKPDDQRRVFHHLAFYGFALCFASTATGTVLHYGLGWQAPYPWYSPVVVLGTLGGVGLLIGPLGLWIADRRRADELKSGSSTGMNNAFLAMLFLTGLTGLLLLVFRATPAMGVLLAVHLGVVFALFLTLPYGKFVHGIFRFAALVRYAIESNAR
jgi:citrate/tricarballylate utilization protein